MGTRRPASARLVVAGVIGACALGVGLGLWARPQDPDRLVEAAQVPEAIDPGPRRALQIVVDDAPAPIGPLLEVLPEDMAGAPSAAPAPAPFIAAPPVEAPVEARVPRRPASGLVKVDAPVAAEPEPVRAIAIYPTPEARAAKARALKAEKARLRKAEQARLDKAEQARARADDRKAEAAELEKARADQRRIEKVRLEKAKVAKADKKRLAEAAAKSSRSSEPGERKLAKKPAKAEKPVKLAKAEARSKREKAAKDLKAEAASQQLAKAKTPGKAKPKALAKRTPKPKVELAEARPKKAVKKVVRPDHTARIARAAPPKKAVSPRGEGPIRLARAETCASADPGEALVCADRRLGARDRQLQQAYRNAEASGVPASALRRQQTRWLQSRAAAAREAPWAVEDVYEARISELNDLSRDAREN